MIYPAGDYIDDGWICGCGHFQGDAYHCDRCHGEPPWGCDCAACDDDYYEDDEDDLFYMEDDECWFCHET